MTTATHNTKGETMTTTTREIVGARIYWDTQGDPEGWAYNLYYDDGHEESGAWETCAGDELTNDATAIDLQEAVVEMLWREDIDIETGDVATESCDGGVAHWTRIDEEREPGCDDDYARFNGIDRD